MFPPTFSWLESMTCSRETYGLIPPFQIPFLQYLNLLLLHSWDPGKFSWGISVFAKGSMGQPYQIITYQLWMDWLNNLLNSCFPNLISWLRCTHMYMYLQVKRPNEHKSLYILALSSALKGTIQSSSLSRTRNKILSATLFLPIQSITTPPTHTHTHTKKQKIK